MTLASHIRATLALGLPLIGGQLAQNAIGLTDTVMMGWYGVAELAAVALGATYFHVVLLIGMGFGFAVMPMVAAASAQHDAVQVRRVTRMGLWIGIGFSALSLPLFWLSEPILLALGQDAQVARDAGAYLGIAGWAIFPAVLLTVLRSHLSALDRAQVVLWAWLGGTALNVALNWVLIFGHLGAPELGLRGAAIASLGTHLLIFGLLAAYSARAREMRGYTLFARFWRPDPGALLEVFRLGWPIALTLLAESGLFMATMILMGWIGTLELAAHGIAIQIVSTCFMVQVGLSSAATIRAGRAWSRGDAAELALAARAALILSTLVVAATILLFLTLGETLVGLFVDPADPLRHRIVEVGTSLLLVATLFQFADAAQVMALGLLRGIKDTAVPMLHAFVSYWLVGLPAAWALGIALGWGGPGVWAGLVIGLGVAGALLIARFARLSRAAARPAAA